MKKIGKLRINHESIKNELKTYLDKPEKALIEYIWNGFDAGATQVNLNFSFPDALADRLLLGSPSIEIVDNGNGWDFSKIDKIELFLASEKIPEINKSLPHGHKGVGRCTFFVFSKQAKWETIFNGSKIAFSINADNLLDYKVIDSTNTELKKGTRVSFDGIFPIIDEDFLNKKLPVAILNEFGWFLVLNPKKEIFINGTRLETDKLIRSDKLIQDLKIDNYTFTIRIIQWKEFLSEERSKYYFLNSSGEEISKRTTGLNNKSDVFHHSVFVESSLYNRYNPSQSKEKTNQGKLIDEDLDNVHFNVLSVIRDELTKFRKFYLKELSPAKIEEWKKIGIFPKKEDLTTTEEVYEELIQDIFIAAPQVFSTSSNDQRKIILRMLASLLGSEARDEIIKILDQVFKLTSDDLKTLSDLLNRTTLSCMINTVKDIERRLDTINALEQILFNPEYIKTTLEVKHLQKILDSNFWIFGEDFRLFTSTEGSIKKTLIKLAKEILKIDVDIVESTSKKELDLLLIRESDLTGDLKNIVIEIKRPSIILGKKELDQIKEYKDHIIKDPSCNGERMDWTFILIGNKYNDYIQNEINSQASSGEKKQGLVHNLPEKKVKVYVKKWSDIINVELKSKYRALFDKLMLETNDFSKKDQRQIVQEITT